MSEYISREELLEKEKYLSDWNIDLHYIDSEDVKTIPSADVKPNIHARWESDGHGHIICTACKKAKLDTHRSKFCDSCGAIMDGERQCEHCLYHVENGCTSWFCIDAEGEYIKKEDALKALHDF